MTDTDPVCDACGSYDRECSSDTPVKDCTCRRCLLVEHHALEYRHAQIRALLATALALQKSLVHALRTPEAHRTLVTEKEAAYLCGEAGYLQGRIDDALGTLEAAGYPATALGAVMARWTMVYREHCSDNMTYHQPTIAAILRDLTEL